LLSCHFTSSPLSFVFHDTPTPAIYTLSLHDALPIFGRGPARAIAPPSHRPAGVFMDQHKLAAWVGLEVLNGQLLHQPITPLVVGDRKSTRLNSSHVKISYAVFCLKKKKNRTHYIERQ